MPRSDQCNWVLSLVSFLSSLGFCSLSQVMAKAGWLQCFHFPRWWMCRENTGLLHGVLGKEQPHIDTIKTLVPGIYKLKFW